MLLCLSLLSVYLLYGLSLEEIVTEKRPPSKGFQTVEDSEHTEFGNAFFLHGRKVSTESVFSSLYLEGVTSSF